MKEAGEVQCHTCRLHGSLCYSIVERPDCVDTAMPVVALQGIFPRAINIGTYPAPGSGVDRRHCAEAGCKGQRAPSDRKCAFPLLWAPANLPVLASLLAVALSLLICSGPCDADPLLRVVLLLQCPAARMQAEAHPCPMGGPAEGWLPALPPELAAT